MSKTKRNSKIKKIILIIVACLVVTGAVGTTWAYVKNQKRIKAEQLRVENERKKIEQEKRRIEEEKKKYTVGVNNNAKKYTYDAKKVSEKLSKYDYIMMVKKSYF